MNSKLKMDNKPLTFVLSGGGARGALQVGALYALLEAGYQPDMMVGTSIGAVNAAFLALHGFSRQSLDLLKSAWLDSMSANLLPSNYVWLAVRAMFGRSSSDPAKKIRDFFISNGMTPDLKFGDLKHSQLIIVSADLDEAKPVLHGMSSDERVLDSLLISTALPPWFMPVKESGHYLVDGGVISNLPIEPAIQAGASQIIALDLLDARGVQGLGMHLPEFLDKLSIASEKRQTSLELELAAAHGIPTRYIGLIGPTPVPFWDFSQSTELFEWGYRITVDALKQES